MDFNKWIAVGKVEGLPQITMNGDRKQASFNFIINDRAPGANGQWVDQQMSVPVYAMDKKADLVEKYVVAGQELLVECKYKSWDANGTPQHGMILLNVIFGFKPRDGAGAAPAGAAAGPPM